MYWCGIDPSINHTGWGIVEETYPKKNCKTYTPKYIASGVVFCDKKQGDLRYGIIEKSLICIMRNILKENVFLTKFIIEKPHYEPSIRGEQCIKNKGINQLIMAAGVCTAVAAEIDASYALITASQWKSVSKPSILSRIEEIFPDKAGTWIREDEWEAVGLALWGMANQDRYSFCKYYSYSLGLDTGE